MTACHRARRSRAHAARQVTLASLLPASPPPRLFPSPPPPSSCVTPPSTHTRQTHWQMHTGSARAAHGTSTEVREGGVRCKERGREEGRKDRGQRSGVEPEMEVQERSTWRSLRRHPAEATTAARREQRTWSLTHLHSHRLSVSNCPSAPARQNAPTSITSSPPRGPMSASSSDRVVAGSSAPAPRTPSLRSQCAHPAATAGGRASSRRRAV